jgi:hypothetical protein
MMAVIDQLKELTGAAYAHDVDAQAASIQVEALRDDNGYSDYDAVYAKGHHNPIVFCRAVELENERQDWGIGPIPPASVKHAVCRKVPVFGEPGYWTLEYSKPGRGAFPVTIVNL